MRELYPPINPYKEGSLQVSDLHTIHFEESGNPQGLPIVLLDISENYQSFTVDSLQDANASNTN